MVIIDVSLVFCTDPKLGNHRTNHPFPSQTPTAPPRKIHLDRLLLPGPTEFPYHTLYTICIAFTCCAKIEEDLGRCWE